MIFIKKLISSLICFLLLVSFTCYADSITIDGDFSDWVDKPGIASKGADDIPIITSEVTPAPEAVPTIMPTSAATIAPPANPIIAPTSVPTAPPATSPTIAPTAEPTIAPTSAPALVLENPSDLLITPDIFTTSGDENNQTNDDNNGKQKYKISQLKWSMGENSDVLYIMLRLSHPNNMPNAEITTEIITDYGEFSINTKYDVGDGSVMTKIIGQNIETTQGNCQIINNNTVYLEYGIPITSLIEDMNWGYQLKFRVSTPDDTEPKSGYIIVSTASTLPYLGVFISAGLCIGIPYLRKRKK